MARIIETDNLHNEFHLYNALQVKLHSICQNYVTSNHIREAEDFYDFIVLDYDTVGLLFCDEYGNIFNTYKSVKINELENYKYEKEE